SSPVPNTPGQETQQPYVFFNNKSISDFSSTFDVDQQPWYIQAFNLGVNDTITVEIVSGVGSGTSFVNYQLFNTLVQLTSSRNKIRIDYPGRYRLVYAGTDNVNTILCVGYPGTMTQESNGVLLEALAALVKTFYTQSTFIQSTTPITLSGNGFSATPYIVGLDPTKQIAFENGNSPITVSGGGTSINPFNIGLDPTQSLVYENGNSPITVSGAGTYLNPFNVGINPAATGGLVTVQGTAPIEVSGTGASGTPYVISELNTNIATGSGNILNTSDAGKAVVLGADGAINSSLLGRVYLSLGTITSGPITVDWTKSRSYEVIWNSNSLLDADIGSHLPSSPGILIFKYVQGTTSGGTLQFTNVTVANTSGVIQPSSVSNISTTYVFYYDGFNIWLIDFTSNGGTNSLGRFSSGNGYVICGDNIPRTFSTVVLNGRFFVSASGTNTYTASPAPAYTAYFSSGIYTVLFTNANTGASTLNISGLGAINIFRRGVAVTSGQIPASTYLQLFYDGTNFNIIGAA
ncbi:MAG: hypothetical protein ACREQ5_08510, partial [Candidatus Dormibacteria bacterium]